MSELTEKCALSFRCASYTALVSTFVIGKLLLPSDVALLSLLHDNSWFLVCYQVRHFHQWVACCLCDIVYLLRGFMREVIIHAALAGSFMVYFRNCLR